MIYEHRTYISPEGRLSDIVNRIETYTFEIFERHGIEVVGFWTKKDKNELVYICQFESEEAMKSAWDSFRGDPEWTVVREKTEANGPIVSKVISEVLVPTHFSPMK